MSTVGRSVGIYLEMIKFSHTIFALPFALLAACVASNRNGGWRWLDLVGIVVCMVAARSAAMGFNRWADRELDAQNPRTRTRALPAALLRPSSVLVFVAVSAVVFFAGTALFYLSSSNPWPMVLSLPVLAFLFGYSYAKRFTPYAHVWLGVALAMAPVAAWIAIRGEIAWCPVLLGLGVVGWVTGFDILYACQDIDVDRQLGLHSIPARFGFDRALWIARAAHGAMLVLLVLMGLLTPELREFYWIGLSFVAGLLIVEHWLASGRDLAHINLAFLYVNGVISVTLLSGTILDLYWGG